MKRSVRLLKTMMNCSAEITIKICRDNRTKQLYSTMCVIFMFLKLQALKYFTTLFYTQAYIIYSYIYCAIIKLGGTLLSYKVKYINMMAMDFENLCHHEALIFVECLRLMTDFLSRDCLLFNGWMIFVNEFGIKGSFFLYNLNCQRSLFCFINTIGFSHTVIVLPVSHSLIGDQPRASCFDQMDQVFQ